MPRYLRQFAVPLFASGLVLIGCASATKQTGSSTSVATSSAASDAGKPTATTVPGGANTSVTTTPVQLVRPTVPLPADCPAPPATTAPAPPPTFPPGKPSVTVPKPFPTELKVTDLIEGSGPAIEQGSVVTANYVGVRAANGEEFDNSYDTGDPFTIPVGVGQVIPGWDQGLIGAKVGTRRQLDIPAALAYGDNPPQSGQGIIKAGDDLVFIIDVVQVDAPPPATDPADAPKYQFTKVAAGTPFSTETITPGTDPCVIAQPEMTVFFNVQLVRGDTLEVLTDSWQSGNAETADLTGSYFTGFIDGLIGMEQGELRLITIPPDEGFGADVNVQRGLEADTVLLALVEFVGPAPA